MFEYIAAWISSFKRQPVEVKAVNTRVPAAVLPRKIVALSIAHYPRKPGASGGGYNEHEHSLVWTDTLKSYLEDEGVLVVLAPIGGLRRKVEAINLADCDAAIEIHFNGSDNPTVSGVETLYCPGSAVGKAFAWCVHEVFAPTMQCRDRGIKEGWYRMDKPYIEDYPGDVHGDEKKDFFLAQTVCPALIIEPEFMAQTGSILAYKDAACKAMAVGVLKFLKGN